MSLVSAKLGAGGRENFRALHGSLLLWSLVAIVLLAVAVQIHLGVSTDGSWYITLAEKLLAGQRPNVDFIEINPPLSFLLYVPPTLAAHLVGVAPEFMVDLFCFVCAGLNLWLAGVILRRGGVFAGNAGPTLAIVAVAALVLLPARTFNERDHIALMTSLPCLAALVVWAAGGRVQLVFSILAGVGAGLAMAIKPPFALFFLFPLVYLARREGWRALVVHVELYVALAVLAFYWGAIIVWFPAFFENVAPIVRDIYLPIRRPLTALAQDPTLILWIALGGLLLFAARKRLAEPLIAVPALASVGAMAAYLIQDKLWPYQGYPAMALFALAVGPLALPNPATPDDPPDARVPMVVAAACAIDLILAGVWFASGADKPELERAVAAISPHPRLLVIGSDVAIGYPLTRRVHGVWVSSEHGLWLTDMGSYALARGAVGEEASRLEGYLRREREMLVADIVNKKPDAILVSNDSWLAWARRHADVAAALANYELRETADNVMVYTPRINGEEAR